MSAKLPQDADGVPINALRPVENATTVLALSTVVANSGILDEGVYRLWSSVNAFVAIGESAIAALATDMPMSAENPEYFKVDGNCRVSAILTSSTGSLYISKMA